MDPIVLSTDLEKRLKNTTRTDGQTKWQIDGQGSIYRTSSQGWWVQKGVNQIKRSFWADWEFLNKFNLIWTDFGLANEAGQESSKKFGGKDSTHQCQFKEVSTSIIGWFWNALLTSLTFSTIFEHVLTPSRKRSGRCKMFICEKDRTYQ